MIAGRCSKPFLVRINGNREEGARVWWGGGAVPGGGGATSPNHINKEEDGVPIGMREEQEKTVIVPPSPIICESR